MGVALWKLLDTALHEVSVMIGAPLNDHECLGLLIENVVRSIRHAAAVERGAR